jgi:Putative Ig domain
LDVTVARSVRVPVLVCGLVLAGCSGDSKVSTNPQPTPDPPPISVTTTSLPDGQVGGNYSATLTATGGKAPLSWAISAGALPAGLALASSGAISGTPMTTAAATPITFTVSDSSAPVQTQSVTLRLTVSTAGPPAISITTTSLPNGQVGHAYSATLTASGGTAPLSWAISSGALPAGLTLASNGVISGTPTATAAATPITFTVSDSGAPAQTQSVTLKLTVSPSVITLSVSPARAALAVTQPLALTATTSDYAGVSWSISPTGGAFSAPSSGSGTQVTLTAPSSAGVYTVTATSVTDTTKSASITVGVTDLAGVYTYHNDLARDGANTQEYALTAKTVNSATFGKLFTCNVDGAVYTQPLWVANLSIGGSRHNVVLVATQHDSLYAFDADASPCLQLWQVSLIDTTHGAASGEVSVASSTTYWLVGLGQGDTAPEVGVTGTPVIDPASGIVYVVSMSTNAAGTSFYQRLHAIDIRTGSEKPGSPALIVANYPGTGSGGTSVAFNAQQERQRASLALVNGQVYIAWASFEDHGPWYGWIMGYSYSGSALVQSSVLNVAPNLRGGGIWMSGGAPAADSTGNIYVSTGNGGSDPNAVSGHTNDYTSSVLRLSSGLTVSDWFMPSAYATLNTNDLDLSSGGATVLVSPPTGPYQHLVITGGKDGTLWVLNGDQFGGVGDGLALQYLSIGAGSLGRIFATPAYWNNTLFLAAMTRPLVAYAFDTSVGKINPAMPTSQSPTPYGFPGATPSVSASGSSSDGIVWAIDQSSYCTHQAPRCGPAVLHAYDATNLANELWNSAKNPGDAAGNAVKFTVPTVANGKVYIGTRGNNTGGVYGSTTISGELDVYGLKPN